MFVGYLSSICYYLIYIHVINYLTIPSSHSPNIPARYYLFYIGPHYYPVPLLIIYLSIILSFIILPYFTSFINLLNSIHL